MQHFEKVKKAIFPLYLERIAFFVLLKIQMIMPLAQNK